MGQSVIFKLISISCILFRTIDAAEFYLEQTEQEFYLPYIGSFLNYLNNQPDRTHYFGIQSLLSVQKEDDKSIKLVLDVKGDCGPEDPSSLCTPAILTCHGIVQNINGNYITQPGIICQPKDKPVSNGFVDSTITDNTGAGTSGISHDIRTTQHTFSEETTHKNRPVQEESINIQHVQQPCLGCPMDLNPNILGVDTLVNTALNHIDSERTRRHSASRVLRVQQQIVAGVKYYVLLEITPTICAKDVNTLTFCPSDSNSTPEICEITFYQKPWVSKRKNIIGNNCTLTQEFLGVAESHDSNHNNENNELHVINSPSTENINRGSTKPSTERTVDLADLESQIVVEPLQRDRQVFVAKNVPNSSTTTGASVQLKEDMFYQGDQPHDSSNSSDESHHKKGDDSSDSSDSSDEHDCGKKKNRRRKKDTSESSDSDDMDDCKRKLKHCKKHRKEDSDDEHQKGRKKCKNVSSNDSDDSTNNEDCKHKHNKIAKKRNCNDDSSSSSSSSSSSEECDKKSKRRKRSSNYLDKLNNDDKILINNLASIALKSLNESDKEYAKQLVSHVLNVKKELLSNGIKYKLILNVTSCSTDGFTCPENSSNLSKFCKVHVLINGDNDTPQILKSKCKNNNNIDETTKNSDIRNKRATRKMPRLGGIQPISVDDQEIIDLIEHSLQYYDSQIEGDYKNTVLNILEASRQLVSGYLYRIKVEIAPSDCLKNTAMHRSNCNQLQGSESYTCNIKVWDQPWLENGRQTNISCNTKESPQKYSFRSKRETNLQFSYKEMDNNDDHKITLETFTLFLQAYGKNYTSKAEFKKRYHIFRQNMKKVQLLNKYEEGTAKYGATQFADLTQEEFKTYLGLKPELRHENNIVLPQATIPNIEIPPEFDWRSKGVVAEVKNQGACGSCWAFSVTGNIEGQYALKYGNLLEFSEQELVDCDSTDEGCSGGLMENAYAAIEKLGGLETEQDYPYEAENEKCHFNKSLVKVKVKGALNISHDETEMAQWLVKNGPISIAINANAMQFYFGGVSHPWKMLCNPQSLDHGVLIVGYGVHKYPYLNKTLPYWIVKNSWGKSWGQQGYYLVYRGDGTCGVNQDVTSAIIE